MKSNSVLRELLNAYWLRPETALWRAIDVRAMRAFKFRSPSLDMGCGDGMFSFIRAGGRLRGSFDVFQSVAKLDMFFDKADVYDAAARVRPEVLKKPSYRIDVGFDHKVNLLAKAGGLGLHRSLKQGDANKRLPFDDGSFQSVFSNIVYWLEDPAHAFSEIGRILKPGGRCCVMLPNRSLPGFSFYGRFYARTGDKRFKFLERLDRGRLSDNIKQAKSGSEWERIFKAAGLRSTSHGRHLSKTTVQLWDIGLRPLFPVLHRMAFALKPKTRAAIKRDWIDIFDSFLSPIAAMDAELGQNEEPAFHCFILEKPKAPFRR